MTANASPDGRQHQRAAARWRLNGLILAAVFGGVCRAQEPGAALAAAASTATVAASTAAVEASTAALSIVTVSSPAAASAGKSPAPRNRVVVHKEAADWDPVSVRLRLGISVRSAFEAKLRKIGKRYRGEPSKVKAAARLHKAGEDRWLVISVYPVTLRPKRLHLEARFLIQEGYLEGVQVASVRIEGGSWSADDEKEDSFSLRSKGIDFNEQLPGEADVELSSIDPGPGHGAFNAGRVRDAAFGGADLGSVNLSWSVSGVSGEKTARKEKPARSKKPKK